MKTIWLSLSSILMRLEWSHGLICRRGGHKNHKTGVKTIQILQTQYKSSQKLKNPSETIKIIQKPQKSFRNHIHPRETIKTIWLSLSSILMRLEWSHGLICGKEGMQGDIIGRCQGPISYFPSFHDYNDDHVDFSDCLNCISVLLWTVLLRACKERHRHLKRKWVRGNKLGETLVDTRSHTFPKWSVLRVREDDIIRWQKIFSMNLTIRLSLINLDTVQKLIISK